MFFFLFLVILNKSHVFISFEQNVFIEFEDSALYCYELVQVFVCQARFICFHVVFHLFYILLLTNN